MPAAQLLQPIACKDLRIERGVSGRIRHHPGSFLSGWWRRCTFLVEEHAISMLPWQRMPPLWFTESARWCAVLGLALLLFFLFRGPAPHPEIQSISRIELAKSGDVAGNTASLPFAPPWDTGDAHYRRHTPIIFPFARLRDRRPTYLLDCQQTAPDRPRVNADSQPNIAIGSALALSREHSP